MERLADYLGGMASDLALPKAAARPRPAAVGSR
jgi:hypothetical protein